MPTIKVRALQDFELFGHPLLKGEMFYVTRSEARRLQSEGLVEMILTRYPERLIEQAFREAVQADQPPGWTKKPCKNCPDKEEEQEEESKEVDDAILQDEV